MPALVMTPTETGVAEWVKLFPAGSWKHSIYGREEMTKERAERIIRNFERNLPREGVPVIVAHDKNAPAVGWVKELSWRDDGLYARVEWNEEGKRLLANKMYRFVSPSILKEWENPATGEKVKDVLIEVSLTNFPFFGFAQRPLVNEMPLSFHVLAYSEDSIVFLYQEHRWVVQRPDYPIRDGLRWDEDAADRRFRQWVSDKPIDEWGNEEWRKYRRRFIVFDDANPNEVQSGKLPVVDIVDGEPVIIANAVRNALARLPQTDIPDDVKERARQVLQGLLERLRESEGGERRMEERQQEDIKALQEQLKRLEEENRKYQERLAQLERERKVRHYSDILSEHRYEQNKIMPPKLRQEFAELLADLDDSVATKFVELLKKIQFVELDERGYTLLPDGSDKPVKDPFEEFERRIERTLKEHPDWRYEQAYEYVKRSDPELAKMIALGLS